MYKRLFYVWRGEEPHGSFSLLPPGLQPQSRVTHHHHHVLCVCPAYGNLRVDMQLPVGDMRSIMHTFDQVKLASLLDQIWATRNNVEPFGR